MNSASPPTDGGVSRPHEFILCTGEKHPVSALRTNVCPLRDRCERHARYEGQFYPVMTARFTEEIGPDTSRAECGDFVLSQPEVEPDEDRDDSPYCDCGSIASEEEEASNRCSCCGKRIDL